MTQAIRTGGILRIVPAELLMLRRPQRMVERSARVYRRTWIIIVSGFFEPLFYLLSIQVGFAALIGTVTYNGVEVPYTEFVMPALMAASAMNGAIYDSTMNVFHKLKYARLYDSVLSTPMSSADVAFGEISWAVLRGAMYSTAFLVTAWALGLVGSTWMLVSLPVCILIGFAFAAIGMAVTSYMRTWADFEYIPAVQVPLFLFSATFFPLAELGSLGWVVQLSPLYHGVAVLRMANFGEFSPMVIVHLGVLVGLAVIGVQATSRRLRKLLLV